MLTILSLKKAQETDSLWQSLLSCTALHITDRIDELKPEDFAGLGHIEQLIIGPELEEMHAENSGFRPSGRKRPGRLGVPDLLFRELRSLRQLEIRMKGITELGKYSFGGIPYLECLILSGNRISAIHPSALTGLENLKSLYLDHNRLAKVEDHYFSSLSFLNILRLNSNRIRQLAPRSFVGNPFLIALDLQHNRISRIDPSTFQGLPNISNLDLSANPLKSADLKFMQHLGRFTEVSIETRKGSLTFAKAALARAI